jgi:hydrogenase-1 operon protein HyaF
MSGLAGIGVKVEQAGDPGSLAWGTALPILHEVRHALARLVEQGEPTVIDLQSIPMGPGDDKRLLAGLGEGELKAELEALGKSVIRECRYPGVWLIEHYNVNGEVAARFIEVAWIPSILMAQQEDVCTGLAGLTEFLAEQEAG